MSSYSTKKALVDLGFVNGYFFSRPSNIDYDGWHECLMDALERIEQTAIKGSMLEANPSEADYRQFLYDLGSIRGWAWQKAVSDAVSEALDRLINFFSGSLQVTEIVFAPPKPIEPIEKKVSDEVRHEIRDAYGKYPEVTSISMTEGYPLDVVERVLEPIRDYEAEEAAEAELAAEDEVALTGVSEVALSVSPPVETAIDNEAPIRSHISILDDQADAVREMSETLTDDEIGDQLGVSRDTVFRFREKHGIKKTRGPREGKVQWEPWQKQKLIELKLAGTHSWSQIGKVVGKTANQCSGMWHWEKKKLDQAGEQLPTSAPMPALSPDDIQEVQGMLDKDSSYETIGEWFGCDAEAVRQFCQDHKLIPAKKMAEVKEAYEARQASIAGPTTIGSEAEDQTPNRPEAVIAENGEPPAIDSTAAIRFAPRPDLVTELSPPHRLTVAHPGYAGKREDGQLNDDDWPDIKGRLARGNTRRAIASDYDVEIEDLEFFIASCQRREAKQPPGESRAPLPSLTSGAN